MAMGIARHPGSKGDYAVGLAVVVSRDGGKALQNALTVWQV
jgi:hypothetical protein